MTLSILGKQYICANFGNTDLCCTKTGLSWYYTIGTNDYPETGGTAQIVSRLASGLVNSLTMTNPSRGTFTQAELNTVNGGTVTLQDALEITSHDEPSEDQWCFITCETHTDQATCLSYGCYWYNGSCHTNPPSCSELNNQSDCQGYGCYWWNGSCHDAAPACSQLDNEIDCASYGCFWYRGVCHTVDQPELCYWIDNKGGHTALTITNVFEAIDSYLFQAPPTGWTFIPTVTNIFGIIDYYLGFNGDSKTGCAYFG